MSRITPDDVSFAKAFSCSSSNALEIRKRDKLLFDALRNLGPARVYWDARLFCFRLRINDSSSATDIKNAWLELQRERSNAKKLSDSESVDPCPTEHPAPRSPQSA